VEVTAPPALAERRWAPHGVRGGGRLRRLAPAVLAVAVYCVLGAFVYGAHSPVSSTVLPPCACGDLSSQTWFTGWPAYAFTHGLNPFYSTFVNVPGGVSLLSNTSTPLLGIVFTPITLLLGPVSTLNLIFRLGFVLSGISMCFVLRRWTTWWPAAFIGGLLYAFSPFMVGQSVSHDFLTFAPLPPILAALIDELVVRRRHLVRNAILLGLAVTAQFLISPEVLAMFAFAAVGALLVMALRHPVAAWERAGDLLVAAGVSLAAFVVTAGYPLYMYLRGPYHLSGPPHPLINLEAYLASVDSVFYPTNLERFSISDWVTKGNSLVQGNGVEHTDYIGIPLLVVLAYIAIRWRRLGIIQLFVLVAIGAWSVTLGRTLYLGTVPHPGIPLPYDLIRRIPLLNGALDLRFSLVMYFALGVVLVVGLDRLRLEGLFTPKPGRHRRPANGALRAAGSLAVAAVGLFPLVPSLPLQSTRVVVPAVFAAKDSPISDGDVVLTYPLAANYEGSNDQSVLWQAVEKMRFKLIAFPDGVGGKNHRALLKPDVLLPPTAAEVILVWGLYGEPDPPPRDAATSAQIRTFLSRYHVDDVTFSYQGVPRQAAIAYYTAALEQAPVYYHGTFLWTHVPRILAAIRAHHAAGGN
jgi:hypothetical protein